MSESQLALREGAVYRAWSMDDAGLIAGLAVTVLARAEGGWTYVDS